MSASTTRQKRDQATVYNYSQYGESAVAVEDGVSVSHERACATLSTAGCVSSAELR